MSKWPDKKSNNTLLSREINNNFCFTNFLTDLCTFTMASVLDNE